MDKRLGESNPSLKQWDNHPDTGEKRWIEGSEDGTIWIRWPNEVCLYGLKFLMKSLTVEKKVEIGLRLLFPRDRLIIFSLTVEERPSQLKLGISDLEIVKRCFERLDLERSVTKRIGEISIRDLPVKDDLYWKLGFI
ncbi:hypothetical protein AVEN_106918-1 [Araneus ventricosus]|uniref:Uncharacterized protein n=1 Tax=Araneus ventricosus TaxID=182803 RepID=A0A4Y2NNV3_ARAVE|nr:hypothetical protein AVEN_106918-1 [Araneus ventricosus]